MGLGAWKGLSYNKHVMIEEVNNEMTIRSEEMLMQMTEARL